MNAVKTVCLLGFLLLLPAAALPAGCVTGPAAITHSPGFAPSPAETVVLDPAAYPKAQCNDGSPGAYAVRRGFGLARNRWVIWLHGGGLCFDQASCTPRWNTPRTSSRAFSGGRPVGFGGGIQSDQPAQNPDFYDANLVVLAYCSSDFWSGGSDGDPAYPASDVRSWHFRGRDIVTSVIRDLVAHHGLGPGQEVLFGGGSAGGIGAFLTINDVQPLLPAGTRLLAAADAGYGIDAQGYASAAPGGVSPARPTPAEAMIWAGSALWRGRGDAVCDARATALRPTDWRAHQDCYSPDFLTHGGFIRTPAFIRQSQDDRMLLLLYSGIQPNVALRTHAAGAAAYLRYFATRMARALATADPWHSVYSTEDTNHVMMETAEFTATQGRFTAGSDTLSTTIAAALGQWYRRPCPPVRDIQAAAP